MSIYIALLFCHYSWQHQPWSEWQFSLVKHASMCLYQSDNFLNLYPIPFWVQGDYWLGLRRCCHMNVHPSWPLVLCRGVKGLMILNIAFGSYKEVKYCNNTWIKSTSSGESKQKSTLSVLHWHLYRAVNFSASVVVCKSLILAATKPFVLLCNDEV